MSVSSNRDLKFGLYKMGIKDCFLKGDSNFANLTKDPVDSYGYYVDAINHSVKVSVDEDGVIGSAYTEVTSVEGNPPSTSNIDFTVKVKYCHNHNGVATDLDSDYCVEKTIDVLPVATILRDGQNLKIQKN